MLQVTFLDFFNLSLLQAVATIFQLIETPSVVMAEVIREISEQMIKYSTKTTVAAEQEIPDAESQESKTQDENIKMEDEDDELQTTPEATTAPVVETATTTAVPSFMLARFLALIGHVAMKMLIHLEFSILNELKRRDALQEEKKIASKKPAGTPRSARHPRVCHSTSFCL